MVKVLCTFGAAHAGGTLRVLADGLSHLSRQPGLQFAFGDLYQRAQLNTAFSGTGISLADVGVSATPYITLRSGLARQIDTVRALPRHCLIAQKLRRAARSADVLYVHTRKELALAAWSAVPPRSGAAIVWHCHGLQGYHPWIARTAKLCATIVAISESTARCLRQHGVPGERILTVPNAIDVDRVLESAMAPCTRPLPARDSRPVVLLPTAQLCAHKGIHVLLEAASQIQDLQVWITGNTQDPATAAYAAHLQTFARSAALERRVHFLGFRTDVYSVMHQADIVCVPSMCEEAFGLVAAEAMALGKPVIVSNRGALPDVVPHGRAGLVIDPEKPENLVAALRELIEQPAYARRLAAEGPAEVRRRFSYDRWARAVAAVLRNAALRTRPSPQKVEAR